MTFGTQVPTLPFSMQQSRCKEKRLIHFPMSIQVYGSTLLGFYPIVLFLLHPYFDPTYMRC